LSLKNFDFKNKKKKPIVFFAHKQVDVILLWGASMIPADGLWSLRK